MTFLLVGGASTWKSDSYYESSFRLLSDDCFSLKNFMVPEIV